MKNSRFFFLSLFTSTLMIGCSKDSNSTDTRASITIEAGSGSVTSAPGSVSTSDGGLPTMANATMTGLSTAIDSGSTSEGCAAFNCDDMTTMQACDSFAQDCPDGEKCTPYIPGNAGAYVETKCVHVTGQDKPGDSCMSEGPLSGIDSCIKGAKCWDVSIDGVGTCIALCTGSADAPICDPPSTCKSSGSLSMCITYCNPLLQDCPSPTEACYGETCAPNVSGEEGQANDPCEFINDCDEGLMCFYSDWVGKGCASENCCSPFCEFPDGACPNADQVCVQFFEPFLYPADDPLLDVGRCGVPE